MRTRNRACTGYDLAWACLVLTFLPVTFEVIVNSYTVLPYYDGWVAVLPPEGWGELLFSPHNEHRIGLIMLLSVWDNRILQGKGYLPELVQLALLGAEAAGFLVLLRRNRSLPVAPRSLLSALIVCAAFSAVQFTNIVWSFQVGFVAAYVLGMTAILVVALGPAARPVRSVLAALALACTGSLGLGGGVLALPCIVAGAWLRRFGWKATGLAALVCGFVLIAYPAPRGADATAVAPTLYHWIEFSLTFLGAPVAALLSDAYLGWPALPLRAVVAAACLGGLLVLSVSAWACFRVLWMFRAQQTGSVRTATTSADFQAHLALMLIMGFVVVSAIVVGYARSYGGIVEAYSSRYLTPTLIGWVAGLLYIADTVGPRLHQPLLLAVLCVAFGFLTLGQWDRLQQSRVHSERMRGAEIAVAAGILRDADLAAVYPDPVVLKPLIDVLAFRSRSIFATPFGQAMGRRLPALVPVGTCRAGDVSVVSAPDAGNAHIVTGRLGERSGPGTWLAVSDKAGRIDGVGLPLRRDWLLGWLTRQPPARFAIYVAGSDASDDAYRGRMFRIDGDQICRMTWD